MFFQKIKQQTKSMRKIMKSKQYELIPLKWDSEYFGIKSARIKLNGVINQQEQDEIIEICNRFRFVTISNNNNNEENNHWLGSRTISFLSDVNIQFIKLLVERPVFIDENTNIKNYLSIDKKIISIARNSFKYSRFFNDPNIQKDKAKNIYVEWTKSSFKLKNKYFAISKRNNMTIGYCLFTFEGDTINIELIAVDKSYQGQRVGKSLINSVESFSFDHGFKKIKVGTQLNNFSAIQFYINLGFNLMSHTSTYHLWNKDGLK